MEHNKFTFECVQQSVKVNPRTLFNVCVVKFQQLMSCSGRAGMRIAFNKPQSL